MFYIPCTFQLGVQYPSYCKKFTSFDNLMQCANGSISHDLNFYNFVQYLQNISNTFVEANSYLQYPYMSHDKYFNQAFNYCISD
jgi:hypothetical protein